MLKQGFSNPDWQDEFESRNASAAGEWCRTTPSQKVRWHYLYLPHHLFQKGGAATTAERNL